MPLRRTISIFLVSALIFSLFTGCSRKKQEEDPTETSQEHQGGVGPGTTQPSGTLPSGELLLWAAEPPRLDGFLQAAPACCRAAASSIPAVTK